MTASIKAAISLSSVLLLALAANTGSASGNNHYQWTDEQGRVVYSDRPPPAGVDYEVISSKSSLKRAVSAEEGAVPAADLNQSGDGAEQTGAQKLEQKKNPELCARARNNVEALTSSAKIQAQNDLGEVRDLSPEEIKVELATARAQIDVYCE